MPTLYRGWQAGNRSRVAPLRYEAQGMQRFRAAGWNVGGTQILEKR